MIKTLLLNLHGFRFENGFDMVAATGTFIIASNPGVMNS